jgi:hypothetical protein
MEFITLDLPEHWSSALFYDDTSGFEYEDDTQFQAFCEWAVKNYGTSEPVDMEEDGNFATYHDAKKFGVLACNVHKYTFIVNNGNPNTSAMTTLAHTMK